MCRYVKPKYNASPPFDMLFLPLSQCCIVFIHDFLHGKVVISVIIRFMPYRRLP